MACSGTSLALALVSIPCCFVWLRKLVSHLKKEEHRLRVYENRVLKVFRLKRQYVTAG
jgi:hypothetical protein